MNEDGNSFQVEALLASLSDNISGVDTALHPLLKQALSTTTSKVPLLDKAKIYVHTAYAINSLVFSYLTLNGVDAKTHPVFQELKRVKNYFEKIQTAESEGPRSKLDKAAAGRFIQHALSGNEELDRKRAQARDNQQAGAKRKLDELTERYAKGNRFEATSKRIKAQDDADMQPGDEAGPPTNDEDKAAFSTLKPADDGSDKPEMAPATKPEHIGGPSEQKPRKRGKDKNKVHQKSSRAPKGTHQVFEDLVGKSEGGDAKREAKDPDPGETNHDAADGLEAADVKSKKEKKKKKKKHSSRE